MASVTGVGNTDLCTQIRAWNSKAVIRTVVYAHIGLPWHVALDTLGARAHFKSNIPVRESDRISRLPGLFVKMMRFGIVFLCAMTLEAQVISIF